MRTLHKPSTTGTRWRRTLSQLYRMTEAAETSPLEILYDRVVLLEREVSALKRNLTAPPACSESPASGVDAAYHRYP